MPKNKVIDKDDMLSLELIRYFDCKLLHEKISLLTGNKLWNEEEKVWVDEIFYVCKEGCNKR